MSTDPSPAAKVRVLFVDDEAMVLDGLRRMLRPMRGVWDMTFVASGPEALAALAASPYDVVVSDMRMPGMDGAQLLTEVMHRWPGTVRLALSGHADHELVMRSVEATHQYLSKPCDPDLLRATIEGALARGRDLGSPEARRLVSSLERLPSLPGTYTRLVELLKSEDVNPEAVGQLIARDLAMTTKLLKLVNSAFFGLRRRVTRPSEAVSFLGLETIKALVLATGIFEAYDPQRLAFVPLEALSQRGLLAGLWARGIARSEGMGPEDVESAFLAGLLHDVGILILASERPEAYGGMLHDLRATAGDLEAEERARFGAHHAEVGGYLLELWGLPEAVAEAVSGHHRLPSGPGARAALAVHGALVLMGRSDPGAWWAPDPGRLRTLGMEGRLPVWEQAGEGFQGGGPEEDHA